MTKVSDIMDKVDREAKRIEDNPEELKRIEDFEKDIGNAYKAIYAKVTREIFHNFVQCCKHEGVTIGEKFTALCEEYAGSNFEGKKVYDPETDWKSLQSRSHK